MDHSDSRRSSLASNDNSIMSHTPSTRNLIMDRAPLEPPSLPYGASQSTLSPARAGQPLLASRPGSPASLSQHYMPQKFAPLSNVRRRRVDLLVPKTGGGREAFGAGAPRMPDSRDQDYDGVQGGAGFKSGSSNKWNRFKWILFIMNLLMTSYSLLALIFCLLTWFNVWAHADILRVGNRPELIVSTIAASVGVFTSLIGWAGIFLNNRAFLATYTFLLWIVFAFLVTPGYITYKKRTFNIEGKINQQWSQVLGTDGRLRVQDQLRCCGYFSPFVEATVSQTCYARSILPGCKGDYIRFQRMVLKRWYIAAFGLVPLQLAAMVAGLLCSNHVTYRFGKGMTPKAYRLDMNTMAVIMDQYANQLAEQYGPDAASEALLRSQSDLALPQMKYDGRR